MKIKKSIFSILGLSLCLGALISCGSKENPAAKETTSIKTSKTSTSTSTSTSTQTSTSTSTSTSTQTLTSTEIVEEDKYTREDNKIYFGAYPQTKVEATSENGLSAITYDSTWTSYKYNIESEQADFMYYKDVDVDNNGTYDYRGVYFTQYRPSNFSESSSVDDSCQYDNGYTTNTIYWFSYDPIEWNILNENDGKAFILADLILDSQDFYPGGSEESFNHNGGTGYVNNYELSAIRKFLNDTFYNTAFTTLQNTIIEETTVDNSASTTESSSNIFEYNNTNDKLLLLSFREATSSTYGLNTTTSRQAMSSDYAKCQGLYVSKSGSDLGCSSWWLRSPNYQYADGTYYVVESGYTDFYYVYGTDFGVRPACWIKL